MQEDTGANKYHQRFTQTLSNCTAMRISSLQADLIKQRTIRVFAYCHHVDTEMIRKKLLRSLFQMSNYTLGLLMFCGDSQMHAPEETSIPLKNHENPAFLAGASHNSLMFMNGFYRFYH